MYTCAYKLESPRDKMPTQQGNLLAFLLPDNVYAALKHRSRGDRLAISLFGQLFAHALISRPLFLLSFPTHPFLDCQRSSLGKLQAQDWNNSYKKKELRYRFNFEVNSCRIEIRKDWKLWEKFSIFTLNFFMKQFRSEV